MPEEKPSLHIDSDWKKQAQEEKRRLAEQEQQQAKAAVAPVGVVAGTATAAATGRAAPTGRTAPAGQERGQLPPPGIVSLAQAIVTQILFYLGDIGQRGAEPTVNLDMAKHQIDTLGVLEEKTRGNLTPEEKSMLDAALYEMRMRFISVSSQYAQLP